MKTGSLKQKRIFLLSTCHVFGLNAVNECKMRPSLALTHAVRSAQPTAEVLLTAKTAWSSASHPLSKHIA